MSNKNNDYSLVIIGAGAAGIGASIRASEKNIDHIVLEASHRIGGRGLTETLENGVAADLGCHWMHCASTNPFVQIADKFGFDYSRTSNLGFRGFIEGVWQRNEYMEAVYKEIDRIEKVMAMRCNEQASETIWDCMDPENSYSPWIAHWYSLMHSNDPDQVSILDPVMFKDSHEDWPLKQGYGALIVNTGKTVPVSLNTAVKEVNWDGGGVKVMSQAGTVSASKVLVTLSTGVMSAGDVRFTPELPVWKRSAIENLPMGNYNNLFFPLHTAALKDAGGDIVYQRGDLCATIYVRPFDQDYVFSMIGGRFAWWLEKQGERAAENWFAEVLKDIFGSDIVKLLGKFKSSAWGFDPLVRGAYSSTRPGAGFARQQFAKPVADKVFFAGEATSVESFNTAHGAWLSGQAAVNGMFS